ncbi:unannotated protein [freshwater metagenome]|uniref:Unannotated protein n=1 Tax=freshwater metagenome TaxID=449393 RepID=A0A6J6XI00_9ZZZZ
MPRWIIAINPRVHHVNGVVSNKRIGLNKGRITVIRSGAYLDFSSLTITFRQLSGIGIGHRRGPHAGAGTPEFNVTSRAIIAEQDPGGADLWFKESQDGRFCQYRWSRTLQVAASANSGAAHDSDVRATVPMGLHKFRDHGHTIFGQTTHGGVLAGGGPIDKMFNSGVLEHIDHGIEVGLNGLLRTEVVRHRADEVATVATAHE